MTVSEPDGPAGPLRFHHKKDRNSAADTAGSDPQWPDDRILALLQQWLEADTLAKACARLFQDLSRLERIVCLLILEQSHDGTRSWAVAPSDDHLVRDADRVLGASSESVAVPTGGQGRIRLTDVSDSFTIGETRVPGFQSTATIRTDVGVSYRVMWTQEPSPLEDSVSGNREAAAQDLTQSPVWSAVTSLLRNLGRMEHLRSLSYIDSVTGISNRAYFNLRLHEEIARAQRFQRPLSLAVFDIDHFKSLNDTYGHQSGDATLREMAEYVRWTIRAIDVFCRVGGDEFAVLMPDADTGDVTHFADRLLSVLHGQRFTIANPGTEVRLSVSMGAAVFPTHAVKPEHLIWCADMALLEAKQRGRNRFLLYEESFGSPSGAPTENP